jgi:predicted ATP-grasp superfamily ATP-dependent carboligase
MPRRQASGPPVIVLGGDENALSIARSLGRAGVSVYALNEPDSPVRFSRFCHWLPLGWADSNQAGWTRYLLGPESDGLRGAVLLAACDAGIELIARHRDELAGKFVLDESNPPAQLDMLDKLATYRQARAAGVPTPRFWVAESPRHLLDLEADLVFPLAVKPLFSHKFAPRFGKKYLRAENFAQLQAAYRQAGEEGLAVMLVELVPGPDDRLCSYYTYLDGGGRPQFHFTKRIVRRFPVNMGAACYHLTDWEPEVRDLSLRLFQHAGLRGLANAEFKRDPRDGRLKLIECNARFTAANCLVMAAGLDLPRFVYNRLVGRPLPAMDRFKTGLRLWYPGQDWQAFCELRRRGELSLGGWLRSVLHRQTFPYFRWDDPLPGLVNAVGRGRVEHLCAAVRRLFRLPARRLALAQRG